MKSTLFVVCLALALTFSNAAFSSGGFRGSSGSSHSSGGSRSSPSASHSSTRAPSHSTVSHAPSHSSASHNQVHHTQTPSHNTQVRHTQTPSHNTQAHHTQTPVHHTQTPSHNTQVHHTQTPSHNTQVHHTQTPVHHTQTPSHNTQVHHTQTPSHNTQVHHTQTPVQHTQTPSHVAAPVHTSTPVSSHPSGGLSVQQLQKMMPHANSNVLNQYAPYLNKAMQDAGINTPARQNAFLAQLGHESGQFRYMQELASGKAYEGRKDLGNTAPGDGVKYKGRGPIQITGKANYAAAGKALGVDLVNHPELAATPEVGFRTAAWFWNQHGLNSKADKGTAESFSQITKTINGCANCAQTHAAERNNLWANNNKINP